MSKKGQAISTGLSSGIGSKRCVKWKICLNFVSVTANLFTADMVQAWVAQKVANLTFYKFFDV